MRLWFSILFVLFASTGCFVSAKGCGRKRTATASRSSSTAETNDLELELLKSFDANGNYFLSPASIKITLGMLLTGAKGRSGDEIREALRVSNAEELQTLIQDLNVKTNYTNVEAANAAFISNDLAIKSKFKEALRAFKADLEQVDFDDQSVTDLINNWVHDKTHGLIPNIASPGQFTSETKLVLANALYFKGQWKRVFDERGTAIKCFHITREKCINTKMMQMVGAFNYKAFDDELDAQVLQLPYKDEEYAMLILLPKEKQTVEGLTQVLQTRKFSSLVQDLQETKVYVNLPKFEIDYSSDISNLLKGLGIKEVFGANANLRGISNEKELKVDKIIQKAKVKVDEKGTTAAAATEIEIVDLIGSTMPNFMADHPFLFFIYQVETNNVLFEGRFNEPHNAYDDIFSKPSNNK